MGAIFRGEGVIVREGAIILGGNCLGEIVERAIILFPLI